MATAQHSHKLKLTARQQADIGAEHIVKALFARNVLPLIFITVIQRANASQLAGIGAGLRMVVYYQPTNAPNAINQRQATAKQKVNAKAQAATGVEHTVHHPSVPQARQ